LLSADSSRAVQELTDAERELESLISNKEKVESDALEIFSVHGFGAEGEWKKLDGTCLKKDTGECVYYFLFGPCPMSSYLSSIVIHMKYVSSGKLNKYQIKVELRSALGQYLKQVMLWTFYSLSFSLTFLLLPGA
jgi:hypothetical protein